MITQKEQQLITFAHYFVTHPWLVVLVYALAIWVIVWKGVALWKAAQNNRKDWFVVLLLVNTLGILEIIYIFFLSKKKDA